MQIESKKQILERRKDINGVSHRLFAILWYNIAC